MHFSFTNPSLLNFSALMDTNSQELKRLVKQRKELSAAIEKQETHLNNLHSSAFGLANYYIVFQGVILTLISNGAKNLKPSDRWFLFTIYILAVLLSLFALIITGIKYIDAIGFREFLFFRQNRVYDKIFAIDHRYEDEKDSRKPEGHKERELRRYIYLAVCMIPFIGFAGVVLVWLMEIPGLSK